MMVLGDTCTRGCRFCAVASGNPQGVVDANEPEHVADAVAKMGLDYLVLTMVDRDDLADGGAAHVSDCVQAIKRSSPHVMVEVLSGDFLGDEAALATIAQSGAEVLAHNIEVVRRLTPLVRDSRCGYDQSLDALRAYRRLGPESGVTKASLMVGVGETFDEVLECMDDLRDAEVEILTIGQYLRPTMKHMAVDRFVTPDEFDRFRVEGLDRGFSYVASGPLVRSSYKAAEQFLLAAQSKSCQLDSSQSLTGVPPCPK
jgi:lipoic acid synthetase